MAASSHVLLLPELLSVIFRHTSPRDLIVQQRTCTTWLRVIQGSIPLQESLCFRVKANDKGTGNQPLQWSPLLLKISISSPRWGLGNFSLEALWSISFKVEDLLKFNQPDASWKAMFVFNSTVIAARMCVISENKSKSIIYRACSKDPDRCKMDRLADTLRSPSTKHNKPEDVITIVVSSMICREKSY